MYINFWYAADWSANLTDEPKRVRILRHDFVLWRDSQGKANCVSDTCIHRGGSLAGGLIKDNCIQCPYHGWRFTGDGTCTKIPSLGPDHKVPARAKIDAYPVQEEHGLIFVFLGDLPEEQRPPIIPIREAGKEGWVATTVDYFWNASYERAIENGLDPAHNEFVHPTHGYSGENDEYRVQELDIEHTDWGFGFMTEFQAPPLKNWVMKKIRDYDGPLRAGSGHHGPNQMWTEINLTPEKSFRQYVFETPVDERTLHTFLVSYRNAITGKWADNTVLKRNFAIAEQDRVVIEKLQPVLTPPSRTKELMMPADKVIGLYRDSLDMWTEKGWRIDTEAVKRAQERGDTVFAIPSPSRRDSKNWVLDPVPLVPPKDAEPATVRAVS